MCVELCLSQEHFPGVPTKLTLAFWAHPHLVGIFLSCRIRGFRLTLFCPGKPLKLRLSASLHVYLFIDLFTKAGLNVAHVGLELSIAKNDLEFLILLPLLPKCWD